MKKPQGGNNGRRTRIKKTSVSAISAVAKVLAGDSKEMISRIETFLKDGGSAAAMEALVNELVLAALGRSAIALARNDRRAAASLLLMLAKMQGKKYMRDDDSLIRAKLVAQGFKKTGSFALGALFIEIATNRNDKQFFIDLGKCLLGEPKHGIKDSALFDNRDRDIAEIVLFHPEMPIADALQELGKRHHHLTEASFKMRKMRLLKAKPLLDAAMGA